MLLNLTRVGAALRRPLGFAAIFPHSVIPTGTADFFFRSRFANVGRAAEGRGKTKCPICLRLPVSEQLPLIKICLVKGSNCKHSIGSQSRLRGNAFYAQIQLVGLKIDEVLLRLCSR
jgi:hypothetical protein